MFQRIFLSFLFIVLTKFSFSQNLISRWQYSWGGGGADDLEKMIPLPGNKYFFAGTSFSQIAGNKTSPCYGNNDFVAMVFDDNGNKLWEKSYGGDRDDQLSSAIKVPGGYLLVGGTESSVSGNKTAGNNGSLDIWVVRIDDNGNLLWDKSYGGADFESAIKAVATPDGGYLIGGYSFSNTQGYNNGRTDFLLLKIDATGNKVWSKQYGGTADDQLHDLVTTSDGNYFLSGTTESQVSGNKTSIPLGASDIWLVKVDPNGNKIWDKSFGTTGGDYRGTLLSLQDGNTLLVESSLYTGRIRKIDNNGAQIWVQSCSGNDQDFFEVATEDITTGNIYVAGESKTNGVGCKTSLYNGGGWFTDIWIAVFDSKGNKLSDYDYGGNDADIATDITVVNNEVWVTGWSDSPLSGNKTTANYGQTADGWIIRLSKSFYINGNSPTELCLTTQGSRVYWNAYRSFNSSNNFIVQLSDMNGSFLSPQTIGSKTSMQSDSVLIKLPAGLQESPDYKIRIVSTNPHDTTPSYPIWLHGKPDLYLGSDTFLCGKANMILDVGLQPTGSHFVWQDGSTNASFIVNKEGLYWCQVQNSCGSKTDSILISQKQAPSITLGKDTSFCPGSGITIQGVPIAPDYTYQWNTGEASSSIFITAKGLYWLQVSNVCGSVSDSILVANYQKQDLTLNKDSILCAGTTRELNAGPGFTDYHWNTGDQTQSITINKPGVYRVTVTDNHACSYSDSAVISKGVDPPANFLPALDSICASYGKLTLTAGNIFSTYLWNNGSNTRSIEVSTPGTYWLTVTDKFSCQGVDSVLIFPKKCIEGFFIPTAFTPNNDGLNDIFKPTIGGSLKAYHFTIYNRWGNILFSSSDPKNGWNGYINNQVLTTGVYIWTCDFQLENNGHFFKSGIVTLIR